MTKELIKQIKTDANRAFVKKEYNQVFSTLEKLDPSDFIIFSEKKGWVFKGAASIFFWNEWVLNNLNYFSQLMDDPLGVAYLHNYFTKSRVFNAPFEKNLALTYPKIFVEAVRKNQVFFKKERIDFLLEEIELPETLKIHQDVWGHFNKIELELWNKIERIFNSIIKYSFDDILCNLVKVIEIKKYNISNRVDQQTLGDSYSFFMDMLLRNSKVKLPQTCTAKFEMKFIKNLNNKANESLENLITQCLENIIIKLNLSSKYFDTYCYNKDFEPQYIYKSLFFVESPEAYYKWKQNGVRYHLTEILYKIEGESIIDNGLINSDFKIKSRYIEDYNGNKELSSILTGIISALKDLKLDRFYFNKTESIEIEKVIHPLFALSYNRYYRYEKELTQIKSKFNDFSWLKAYTFSTISNTDSKQFPFVYLSRQEYKNLNNNEINNVDEQITEVIVNLFSQRIDNGAFNRFNIRYSVFLKPFLEIGDHLFCPVSFFTSFSSLYVYVNSLLKNNGGTSAKQIEIVLSDLLKSHNFNVMLADEQEEVMEGDSDLIVYDETDVLLIQCKRTYLRLSPRSQYEEYLHDDSKAANQLNKAEEFLNTDKWHFKINGRRVNKWIVSNSFENAHSYINHCLKVNYLDLILLLKSKENVNIKTLSDFICYNQGDTFFKTRSKEIEIFRTNFALEDSLALVPCLVDFDPNKAKKYRYIKHKGIELNLAGRHKESINELKKCLIHEANDVFTHGALANVYADLKDFKNSIIHFKKALNLLPYDPFISRNYIGCLFEKGDVYESLEYCLNLIKRYPFLDEINELYDQIFVMTTLQKSLSMSQLKILATKRQEIG